ncbi:PREDICTED: uncharacterized protein LOC106809972 [Priapulus caudatus]|uniref:Uncharacterized protein LOC106809972 n=1 Tax=Priapulus caudatus TaxID=37621 RepID=A0ABM1E927_PRICU|nr:PREDICTED: uncharacterized protein LOC106809972 [Priapulus caudatus]
MTSVLKSCLAVSILSAVFSYGSCCVINGVYLPWYACGRPAGQIGSYSPGSAYSGYNGRYLTNANTGRAIDGRYIQQSLYDTPLYRSSPRVQIAAPPVVAGTPSPWSPLAVRAGLASVGRPPFPTAEKLVLEADGAEEKKEDAETTTVSQARLVNYFVCVSRTDRVSCATTFDEINLG